MLAFVLQALVVVVGLALAAAGVVCTGYLFAVGVQLAGGWA